MLSIVGCTGFVGTNLVLQKSFDGLYNSKNIYEAYGTNPELLVYSGVRAEKYLANNNPEKDYANIQDAITNIERIKPKFLVLISTVDVYKNPMNVDEDSFIDVENLHPYGLNRYLLEKWVVENIKNYLIIRLPGLYGVNLKKNFIFDMINIIPSMLTYAKYTELSLNNSYISGYYTKLENGFYKCNKLTIKERNSLKAYFNEIGFSALNFTDSRANFQFYNLACLWNHIQIALHHKIKKMNIATEPVTPAEIFRYINHKDFVNEVVTKPIQYNFKTKYADTFNGTNGYIFNKSFILKDIKNFIKGDLS